MNTIRKKRQIPNTYVIVFAIILISAAATWLVPGGAFDRQTIMVNGVEREVVVRDSFHEAENSPQSWEILSSIFDGFVDKADIIVFILVIGASFWIINSSKALDIGIIRFLNSAQKLEKLAFFRRIGVRNLLIVLIMLMFSIFGAVFGMSEETIAFVIIFVPLSIKMGFDSIVGVSMCFVGAALGFAGAMFNPFTIGIAQGIAQIPLFTGLEYRFFMWIVINFFGIGYVLWYANRILKNPEKSPVYKTDEYWRNRAATDETPIETKGGAAAWISFLFIAASLVYVSVEYSLTNISIGQMSITIPAWPVLAAIFILPGAYMLLRRSVQLYILHIMMFTILVLVVGVLGYGWYIREIAALFLGMGLMGGLAFNYRPNEFVKQFLDGAKDIFSAAFIVGLAGGIIIILKDGGIVDTMLNGLSGLFAGDKYTAVGGMYTVQTAINLIMPSGSAKAALTMPLMAPFSDLIGISRQATVVAFQLGDGFTNMITPVSGVLLGVLSMAKIPYELWFKWAWKFILMLTILGFLLLIPTVTMQLNGF
ncbi:MAG: short-chain fatty acid transporter [Bacteroidetes bacterium HGW-Bacteroidetes-6]|jgi:uncharacterized ion transporter superfamily protein YfcC|nr:MAG: short-chain fatty acid transporter [Bacteroidetes bacterium HGW-Bacteroidetes-6]